MDRVFREKITRLNPPAPGEAERLFMAPIIYLTDVMRVEAVYNEAGVEVIPQQYEPDDAS